MNSSICIETLATQVNRSPQPRVSALRRPPLLRRLGGLLLALVAMNGATAAPNILWIMADDLRPQLGCYGDKTVRTPHLDTLAERSLRFDRAYVQSAVCSPSRNSMLSGLRPNTTGLLGFGKRVRSVVPDIVTLPQHFKENGYHALGFGKIFHIYDESMLGSEDDPESWSEPLWLPTVPVWGPRQNKLRNRLIAEARAAGKTFSHPHDWPRAETWDDSDLPDDQMQDGQTTKMAVEFLHSRRDHSEPFFLAVGYLRPHLPFNAPRRYWDLYAAGSMTLPTHRQIPLSGFPFTINRGFVSNYHKMPASDAIDDAFRRRYIQAYYACISYVDACVGRLMTALDQSGHLENTVIVFLGDHGYQMGEYDSWGHKHANFEISTRAPLLISKPSMSRAGEGTLEIVEFLDLYPTLCELADLEHPKHLEGQSFAGLLDKESPQKGYACSEIRRRAKNKRVTGHSVRTSQFRFTRWKDMHGNLVARELYDHRSDDRFKLSEPGLLETRNVIHDESFAATIQQLETILETVFQ
ncbi:MAG: sulfatase [Planctomycetota bacterium]